MIGINKSILSTYFVRNRGRMNTVQVNLKNTLSLLNQTSFITTGKKFTTLIKEKDFLSDRLKTKGNISKLGRKFQMIKSHLHGTRFVPMVHFNNAKDQQQMHPVRSVLFTPGINERALVKGRNLDCDVLVMDLEDAVTPEKKIDARELVMNLVGEGGYGDKLIAIRANGVGTPWMKDDIAAVASSNADILIIPKVSSPDTLFMVNDLLIKYQAKRSLRVWAMIETAKAVMSVKDIACSGMKQLDCLLLGNADLTKDLNARHTVDRIPLTYALSKCVVAARAYGLKVVDGVHLDIHNEDTFRLTAEQGRNLGFDGKSLLHPKDVKLCNEIFGTTEEEAIQARKIINAFAEAKKLGKGVVVVDGKLIENLHVEEAYKALAMYDHDKRKAT